MTENLEAALRETLRERANDIATLPPRLSAFDPPDEHRAPQLPAPHRPRPHPRWRWLLAAAAAVAVAAVAGIAVGVRGSTTPAAPNTSARTSSAPRPSPSPSASKTSRVAEMDGLHAKACTVSLPVAWQQAIESGTVTVPGYTLRAMAISPSGAVVADASNGTSHKLMLIDPTGSIKTLVADNFPASWGEVDFTWAAFSGTQVAYAITLGSGGGGPGPSQLELVDTRTGTASVVRATSGRGDASIVANLGLVDGAIYWQEYVNGAITIYEYEIASAQMKVLARGSAGAVQGPFAWGGGLYWLATGSLITHIKGVVPPHFATQSEKNADVLIAANGLFTWIAYDGQQQPNSPAPPTILWLWRKGMTAPLAVTQAPLGTPALALPYLVWGNGGTHILDTRTGASAAVGDPAHGGPSSSARAVAIAAGGRIALEIPHATGAATLSTFSVTGLPPLKCPRR